MTEQNQEQTAETQEQPRVHGSTRKAADMDLAKKAISPDSHRAIYEGRITLEEARQLGREGSPFGPAKKIVSKNDRTQECWCGVCGQQTSPGRRFRAGHDQRAKGMIVKAVREGTLDRLSEKLQEYAAERDLVRQTEQRMADEEAKKVEKAKQKATKKAENE